MRTLCPNLVAQLGMLRLSLRQDRSELACGDIDSQRCSPRSFDIAIMSEVHIDRHAGQPVSRTNGLEAKQARTLNFKAVLQVTSTKGIGRLI